MTKQTQDKLKLIFVCFGLIIVTIVLALIWEIDLLNLYFCFINYFLDVFAPGLAIIYLRKYKMPLETLDHDTEVKIRTDRAIVSHVLMTLVTCLTLMSWGLLLLFIGWGSQKEKGGWEIFQLSFIVLTIFVPFIVALYATFASKIFINVDSYLKAEKKEKEGFLWPPFLHLVKAPISICRIILIVLILLVPFIGKGILPVTG